MMMLVVLFALIASVFGVHTMDPGYPRSANFPVNYTGAVSLRYGAAFGVINVGGTFGFSYNVSNQYNRHAKFQVMIFDRRNFAIYMADNFTTPQCINVQTCNMVGESPRSGQMSMAFFHYFLFVILLTFKGRVNSMWDDLWIVVRNRNAFDNANLVVSFIAFRARNSIGDSRTFTVAQDIERHRV